MLIFIIKLQTKLNGEIGLVAGAAPQSCIFIMGKKQEKQREKDAAYTISVRGGSRRKRLNRGPWSLEQTQLYLQFLQENKDIMQTNSQRRANKIFVRMSKFIKSRGSEQCRTHHQRHENSCANDLNELVSILQQQINMNARKKNKNQVRKVRKDQIQSIKAGLSSNRSDAGMKLSVFESPSQEELKNHIQVQIILDMLPSW